MTDSRDIDIAVAAVETELEIMREARSTGNRRRKTKGGCLRSVALIIVGFLILQFLLAVVGGFTK